MVSYDGKKLMQTIISTEEKVSGLYKELSEKVKDKHAKKVFESLAADEAKHAKMYSALLEKITESGTSEITEEDAKYTDLLISSNIYTNENKLKRYIKSDALQLAEKIERDEILFYERLIRIFPHLIDKEIESIVIEEKKHLEHILDSQMDIATPALGL
ncbi:MAG: ferritin family protein [Clostridiaceae bacterium]